MSPPGSTRDGVWRAAWRRLRHDRVGIASLGVATYLFLRSDRRPAASSPYAPRVSLGIASASVSGRF